MKYILACILIFMTVNVFAAEAKNPTVMIFVSFSMPKESLKGWLQEAEKIQAPVIIRGLVNNSFKATINKMAELTLNNHGGVQLDPTLFKQFDIQQVPAVVVRQNNNCVSKLICLENYHVIYGDVHLEYALQKIAELSVENDDIANVANIALKRLRGQHD
ncbi:MAG TPA: type-F conjugative transfer system pilin assembly protein TrbC [Gammaproteobacteria bacterium]|nr:type-F conjugative transfer system pilin assembly protein TrbC [Gammaproteobacteria bacterium]